MWKLVALNAILLLGFFGCISTLKFNSLWFDGIWLTGKVPQPRGLRSYGTYVHWRACSQPQRTRTRTSVLIQAVYLVLLLPLLVCADTNQTSSQSHLNQLLWQKDNNNFLRTHIVSRELIRPLENVCLRLTEESALRQVSGIIIRKKLSSLSNFWINYVWNMWNVWLEVFLGG